MSNGRHDDDHTSVLLVTSSSDGKTPVVVWGDPTTHRLLVSSSATTVYTETPSGTIDGINQTYTTLHSINSIFSFAINGMFLHPTADYTFAGNTITFGTALPASLSGLPFTVVYQ